MTFRRYVLLFCTAASIEAWQFPQKPITFPPNQGSILGTGSNIDIVTGSQFNGLTTYANLPYLNCLSNDEAEGQKYDIAILGAPFDTLDPEPGTGHGVSGSVAKEKRRISGGVCTLVVSGRKAANESYSAQPRIITLGGDHTTTLSALRSTYTRWGQVSVIHFDSHIELETDEFVSIRRGLNHGTFLHIAHEEGLIRNTSIHAGIRAPLARRKGDMRNDIRCGFTAVRARDLDRIGAEGVVSRIKERVGDSKVYISVDIDVLDPAFAPATGTPEPGGWSSREVLTILDGLNGLDIVGADVVEVSPVYDTTGQTTALAAAEVVWSLIELMVENPVGSRI
ncbi:hypothetical protein AAE478_009425 [Parahypoxylon ruwenzoriense]